VTFAIVALWLGLQPVERMVPVGAWWMKTAYAAVLALLGLALTLKAARPAGGAGRGLLIAVGAVVLMMIVFGLWHAVQAEPETRLSLWLGGSWTLCAELIALVSTPIWLGAAFALRRLAPTSPARAGAAAGLLAGGAGAVIYALHCPELAPAFVATWYTLGIGACVALGALAGSRLLRW
jgi:hypothetical protein